MKKVFLKLLKKAPSLLVFALVGCMVLGNPRAVEAGTAQITGMVVQILDDLGITSGGVYSSTGVGAGAAAGDLAYWDGDSWEPITSADVAWDTTDKAFESSTSSTGLSFGTASYLAVTNASGSSGTGRIQTGGGTAAAPAYTYGADTNSGVYRSGADQIGVATAGVLEIEITATGVDIPDGSLDVDEHILVESGDSGGIRLQANGANGIQVRDPTNVSWKFVQAEYFTVGGDADNSLRDSGLLVEDGTSGTPAIRFNDDSDTGLYRPGADQMQLVGVLGADSFQTTVAAVTTLYNVALDASDSGTICTISLDGSSADIDGVGTNIIQVDTTTLDASYGRSAVFVVTESGSAQLDLAFHASWKWDGTEPTSLAADGVGVLYIWSYGSGQDNIVASWSEMQ